LNGLIITEINFSLSLFILSHCHYDKDYQKIIKRICRMTIWFVAAAVVLIVELFIGTVYLLVVSVALAAAGIMYGLSGHFSAAVLTAAIISALGIWLVHGRLKNQLAPQALNDDLDIGQNVRILRHLHDNIYEVAYRGTHWQAQAERPQDTFQTASSAVITAKNGNLLIIRTLSQSSS
jgi:hypothetical protein